MMKGPYKEAYKLGFAMGFLPKEYGGGGISNVDLQIVAEETTAVDPGFATILLVNGLGLMPVAWYGSEEQKRKWIGAATSDKNHEYLAGWTVSEPGGRPVAPGFVTSKVPALFLWLMGSSSDSVPEKPFPNWAV